jgi:hypothetical protein
MPSNPLCRACYMSTLTKDERDRFNAEPVTMPIFFCAEHEMVFTPTDIVVRVPRIRITLRFTPYYDSDSALNSWESEGGR